MFEQVLRLDPIVPAYATGVRSTLFIFRLLLTPTHQWREARTETAVVGHLVVAHEASWPQPSPGHVAEAVATFNSTRPSYGETSLYFTSLLRNQEHE